jgi:ATP-dependent DNA helicase HFM1/MER3
MFGKNLCEAVPDTVNRFSNGKPTIVFCHSKNDTEKLADLLARSDHIGDNSNSLSNIASQTRLRKLQMAMIRGVAYHHAGLDTEDRRLVEKAFLAGRIRVLCATTTLAMGVNLPAHLVIIMGTRAWRGKAGYQDLDQASLLQMIGRAGRPGFDTTGTAVILTDLDSKHKFESLVKQGLSSALSQCVGDKLVETFNAEISQRVITSVETASNWIMNSLFFIQGANNLQSVDEIEARVTRLCDAALNQLKALGVVVISPTQEVFPLAASHTMSSHLVGLDAFKVIISIPFDASQCQLLKAISSIEDLQRPLKKSEKRPLNAVQKAVKFHLEGTPSQVRVKENWEKAFVLLQVHIARLQLECGNPTLESTLRNETASMVDFASRMLAAIEEYSWRGSKNGHVVFQSLRLRRALALNMWGPEDGVLGQIKGISKDMAGRLRMHGITSFHHVLGKSTTEIETAAGRVPPFGTDLQSACRSLVDSALAIEATVSTAEGSLTPSDLNCKLRHRNANTRSSNKAGDVRYSLLVFTDQPGGCLLFKDNISETGEYRVMIPPKYGRLSIRLVASVSGLDGTDRKEIKRLFG